MKTVAYPLPVSFIEDADDGACFQAFLLPTGRCLIDTVFGVLASIASQAGQGREPECGR
jgi:hypothetical protein